MSGTLDITEELCWMPASGFYNDVLEAMASSVEGDHPELAARLLQARSYVGSSYLDLRDTPAVELRTILDAAMLHLEKIKAAGPACVYDPIFYPGYVKACEELCEMLRVGLTERSPKSSR